MKRQLITLLSIMLIITACRKNESGPIDGNDVSLGNDSLVNRLKLKPSDKQGLSIKSQLLKDSKGAYVILGEKNNKYWLGYFDGNGNELSTKTFDDPTEMKAPYGATIKLNFIHYYDIIEASGVIFIARQLRENNSFINDTFVESLIRINTNSYLITNSYTAVYDRERSFYTSFIGPWFNNTVIISKTTFNPEDGNFLSTTGISSAEEIFIFGINGKPFDKSNRNYVPLSMTEFLDLRTPRYASRRSITNTANPVLFNTDLFPSLIETDRVTIKKQVVENNILTTEADILSYNGDKQSLTSKLDVRTGQLLN